MEFSTIIFKIACVFSVIATIAAVVVLFDTKDPNENLTKDANNLTEGYDN